MKRIWIFLMAMLCIVSFTGCDKTDEPNGPDTDYDNLFDKTYTINDDGCCVLESCEPTRATVIEDEVKGYGWKVIGMYEVQNDGRLSQKDYRETVWVRIEETGSPCQYSLRLALIVAMLCRCNIYKKNFRRN